MSALNTFQVAETNESKRYLLFMWRALLAPGVSSLLLLHIVKTMTV